jgi:RND family efflux transporter MFP subunit
LSQAEKNLSDLKSSNSENPLSIKQAVDSARLNLSNTEKTGLQNVNNSYNSLVSSLDYNLTVGKSALDAVKRIVDDEDVKEVFSVKNSYYKDETSKNYDLAVSMVSGLELDLALLRVSYEKNLANQAASSMSSFLSQAFKTLNSCFNALENSIISSSFPQASLDSFKSSVSSHTSLVNAAISSNLNSLSALNSSILNKDINFSNAQDAVYKAEIALSDAISAAEDSFALLKISSNQQLILANSKFDSASKSYEVYKLQLDKLKSPARSEDLKLVQAQVDQASSSLDAINKQIEENKLQAPISGKVVKINYEIGEQVLNSVPFMVLLTENDFEVELFISESDISKIKIGNEAEISFDAFNSDNKVSGKVYFIEPAATSISDIIYYKTKVVFSEDELIKNNLIVKAGMTANVVITSNEKNDVFSVPFRAIIEKDDGKKIVRVLSGSKINEVEVEVGMGGDQAMYEIISGDIKEGDKIITAIKNGN